MIVKEVSAKKIKDSRGELTIEVSVNGCRASSPSGKSTGKYETTPYGKKKGIDWNINFLNSWNEAIDINRFEDIIKLERAICKKVKLKSAKDFGANALFAFESAVLKALAKEKKKELWQLINSQARKFPIPVGNAVGGGVHSHNFPKPDFQEFLVIPQGKNISENIKIMNDTYALVGKRILGNKKNDEGAWETNFRNEQVIDLINEVRKEKGNFKIGVDMACSTLFKDKRYQYGRWFLDREKQIKYVEALIANHDLFYIEDPMQEEDFSGFAEITKRFGDRFIVGDDLTATQIDRLEKAIKIKAINAIIVKPNQNGSLIEVKRIFDICKKHKITTIMSHRSGETMDNALADYAFGFGADYIKCGISGKEREAKLKRLLEIGK